MANSQREALARGVLSGWPLDTKGGAVKTKPLFISLLAAGVVVVVGACSSDEVSEGPGAGGAAGAGGSDTGGSGGSATGGSGGSATGGSAGTGGSATGGSGGALAACDAPASGAALCLSFAPETVNFESDPRLDGSGILFVQIYDTPLADGVDGGPQATPLHEEVVPMQGDAGVTEVALMDLPTIRVEGLPETVYIRSFFADNLSVFGGDLTFGVWIGGVDLSAGLVENMPLTAVALTNGEGTSHVQALEPLRRFELSVSLAAGVTPEDEGTGPATAAVLGGNDPAASPGLFGLAQTACADVSAGAATLEGFLVGSGDYYVTAVLDDFNLGGDLPEGSLFSFDIVDAGAALIPEANKVTVASTDYTVSHAIELTGVVPVNSPPGPRPQSYACTP